MEKTAMLSLRLLMVDPDGDNRLSGCVELGTLEEGGAFLGFHLDEVPKFMPDLTGHLVDPHKSRQVDGDGLDYEEPHWNWGDSSKWTQSDRANFHLADRFSAHRYFETFEEAELNYLRLRSVDTWSAAVELTVHVGLEKLAHVRIIAIDSPESRVLLSRWPSMVMPAEYYEALFEAGRARSLKSEVEGYRDYLRKISETAESLADEGCTWRDLHESNRELRDSRNFWEREDLGFPRFDFDDDDGDEDYASDYEAERDERRDEIRDGVARELRALNKINLSNFAENGEILWSRCRTVIEWGETLDGERSYIKSEDLEVEEVFLTAGHLSYKWLEDQWVKIVYLPFEVERENAHIVHVPDTEEFADRFIAENFGS